jgi:hypothetical protein
MKKVPIYFYYLRPECTNVKGKNTDVKMKDFIDFFDDMLKYYLKRDLMERKADLASEEKVIWLEGYNKVGYGCYDLTINSAKYNHVRRIINTTTMEPRKIKKQRPDGDEEKTHLCIRYNKGKPEFICVHESNYYGMAIGRVVRYIIDMMKEYCESIDSDIQYHIAYQVVPCEDFLEELRRMRSISVLKLSLDKDDLSKVGFLRVAGRNDIKNTVELCVHRKSRKKDDVIPKSLIKEYFKDYNEGGKECKIKRIIAEGTNDTGTIRLDTELIKMKHAIEVDLTGETAQVDSKHFFLKAQELIDNLM